MDFVPPMSHAAFFSASFSASSNPAPDGTPASDCRAAASPCLGLAPFLRKSIAGEDLRQLAGELLQRAQNGEENPGLWLDLSTAFFALGQRDMGLAIQAQALAQQRLYRIDAVQQPARFRLLLLMAAGDLADNTPLDCLLENGAVDLLLYYAEPGAPLPDPLPFHDALFVAMSEKPANRPILAELETRLNDWPWPVINRPRHIPNTERERASRCLQGINGLEMPLTHALTRSQLQDLAEGKTPLAARFADCAYPIIVRPQSSQAGRDLARIDAPEAILPYLEGVQEDEFFLSRFVDYRGADGLFRKIRLVLIQGRPFVCHLGISAHWMIHYLNAGMYEDAAKREEEARFMAAFPTFAARHQGALAAIHERIGLDYVCIDCAETQSGELLIFEIDHIMVVHAMDPVALFPYKVEPMRQIRTAFEDFLDALTSGRRLPGAIS